MEFFLLQHCSDLCPRFSLIIELQNIVLRTSTSISTLIKKVLFILYSIKKCIIPKIRTLLFIVAILRSYKPPAGSFPATVLQTLSLKISVLSSALDAYPPVTMINWPLYLLNIYTNNMSLPSSLHLSNCHRRENASPDSVMSSLSSSLPYCKQRL